jgi:hypothetical protein
MAGIFLFFRRRKSRNQQTHQELPTSSPSIDGSNWTQLNRMQKLGLKSKTSELDSSTRFEAGEGNGNGGLAQLGGGERSVVYEMEGSLVDVGAGGVREKNKKGEHPLPTEE